MWNPAWFQPPPLDKSHFNHDVWYGGSGEPHTRNGYCKRSAISPRAEQSIFQTGSLKLLDTTAEGPALRFHSTFRSRPP